MNEQEVSKYLKQISKGEIELHGLEMDVAHKFQMTGEKVSLTTTRLNEMKKEMDVLRNEFIKLSYEMNVYEDILIENENKRQAIE